MEIYNGSKTRFTKYRAVVQLKKMKHQILILKNKYLIMDGIT